MHDQSTEWTHFTITNFCHAAPNSVPEVWPVPMSAFRSRVAWRADEWEMR
jgi:hypothetical protein